MIELVVNGPLEDAWRSAGELRAPFYERADALLGVVFGGDSVGSDGSRAHEGK